MAKNMNDGPGYSGSAASSASFDALHVHLRADLADDIATLGARLLARGRMLVTAESCTAGLVAYLLTTVPGASDWCAGGVVAYSLEAKERLLGVPRGILDAHGAVSRETVRAMGKGALDRFGAQAAVSVSGVAGPTGGTAATPVGTVVVGWAWPDGADEQIFSFAGDRAAVTAQAACAAIGGLLARIGEG